jgi:RNA polymerase-binding transcription factor DksA
VSSKRPPKKAKAKTGKVEKAPEPPPKKEREGPPPKSDLSKQELAEFRALLLLRKRVLQGDVKGLEGEAMKKGSDGGDLSTLPMHLADLGTDSFEQEMSLGLMESESDELQQVQNALERIADGSFGLCENCRRKIPKERLKAIPYTRLCVNCKMKEEGV